VSVTPTAPVDLVRLEEDLEEAWEDENWAEAIAIIEQILVIDPFRDDMLERLYVARVGYGYQLLAAGDRAAAATQFSLALEIEPSGEQALAGLEQAAATPSPTQTAEQQLERQLDVAWAAEDWEKAMSLIEQILAISPGRGDMVEKLYAAHVNYGYQLMGEGKLDEAKEQFILALDVKPDGGEAQAGLRALSGGTIAPTPAGGYVIHIVQPGETLYRIAMRYGVTVEAVRAANGLTSNIIYVGQRLRIPVQ
jgi:tetratricopeptide (TPR) repeat protein